MKITESQLRTLVKEQSSQTSRQTANLISQAISALNRAAYLLEEAGQDEALDAIDTAIMAARQAQRKDKGEDAQRQTRRDYE
tara:strand:- start:2651 stop:2896 length:246 start_codon:yes stop_codon:yes gene_type:complete